MKKLLIFILLISFTARPVYYAGYLAYFQLNIESIIDKYCINKEKPELACNGKCHLSKKITSSIAKTDHTKNSETRNVVECFFPVFFQNHSLSSNYKIAVYTFKKVLFKSPKDQYSFEYKYQHFRPPVV